MKNFTFSALFCNYIGNLLNLRLLALSLLFVCGVSGVWGQSFTDNAGNYSSWTNGSNLGTGFGAWSLSAGANSGSFLGNPANNGMGTTGIGTNAFGLYATGSAYMNAQRPFSNDMEVGDKFTFYWSINWDANGGGKGFDFKNGSTTIFTLINSGSSTITAGGVTADANYGTTPMLVTLIRTSSTQYSFSMTSRSGGSTYNSTINSSSAINAVNFFIGNQNEGNGNRNMYFNHLTIEKGRYRSKATGNWNSASTWEVSNDGGSTWSDANSAPSNASGPITILNTHEVTVSSTITIDQTTINSGGKVILATGGAITVADGVDANDLIINGTYERQAAATTLTPTGTVFCGSGGTYIHNASGGSLPTINWDANSTLQIDASLANNEFTENFGNVVINGTSTFFMRTEAFSSSIQGNFTHNGSASVAMTNSTSNGTLTIGGNLTISGIGTLRIQESANSTLTRNHVLVVNGNYIQTSGTLNLSNEVNASATSGCIANLQVKGNFTHTGGTISETAAASAVVTRISLTGTTGTQTLESISQTGSINFNVAASNAQCVIAAAKTFTLSSGSKMTIGAGTSNPDLSVSGTFLNQATTALTATSAQWAINNGGNYIHNTTGGISTPIANATFNSGSTMTYRGSSSLTPSISLSGRTYHHLVIESTSGALSLAGTGGSSLIINGNLTIGANCTFGPNVTGTPGHSIKGNITIGSGGTLNYSPASPGTINLNGTGTQTISGAGTFTTGANATLAVGASSTIDFGTTNAIAGSGTFTTASGSTLITANTSGINGSLTLTNKSLNAGTNYTFNGSSAQVIGAAVTAANNITLNNSAGLTLSANTSVIGTLTLTNGKLTLGASDLTLGAAASVSGASSTKYIVTNSTGQLKKASLTNAFTFPVGNSAYNPISITNAGTSDTYGVLVTDGAVANATVSNDCVNRRWFITEATGGGGNLTVAPQYNTGETGATYTTGSQVYVGLYVPTTWTKTAATTSGSNPFTASASGFNQTLASNSYFAIGNEGIYIAAPTVTTTVAASSITNTTASSGGETLSGTNITSKGVVWNTSTAPTTSNSSTDDGTGTTNFSSSLTSLSPQTLYYIRAYASNAAGTGYGDEKTFRTLSNPATVQATSLSATATSSSNIDLTWNAATFPSSGATNKGYVLLRAASPNTPSLGNSNGAAPTAGSNTTIVSSVITENTTSISSSALAASTQYNYLLIPYTWDGTNATTYNYLTTSAPTANATTQSGSTPPVLTTNAASSVLSTTATLNGEITADGGASVTARGFVYSTSDNTPTIGEGGVTDQASGSGTGTFNSGVTSLSPNTTYYYQAYATNTSGTSYGGVVSFTTLKAEPSAQATSLIFSSITTSAFSTAFTAATGSPDGYLVIRSTSSSLSANPVDGTTYTAGNSLGGGTVVSVGSTISGISNTSLSAGTTYYTFVFAYNNSGSNIDYRTTSPLSESTITLTDAPATPTFSSITTSGFTVDWVATSGASSYKLDISTASNFASFVSGYQDLTVNGTSQAVTGLTANTLYYARIRAVNASGTSANSTSGNSATLSNAPTVGTASSITTSGLTANWSAPSSQGAVTFTYTVELSTNSSDFSSTVSTVSSIPSGTTTNAFSSLAEGTTYYYRIKAVNSSGSSAWSSVSAGATTLTSSISLTDLGTSVTQNFDGISTSTSLPSGWRMHASTSTPSWSGASTTVTQQASSGTPTAGGTYNWGTSTSERAVGAMTSGSFGSPNQLLVYTKNNTGSTITNFTIAYTAERYRVNSASASVRFYYSSNGSSWTEVTDGEIATSNFPTGSSSYTFSTPLEIERTFIVSGLSVASNADFYLRWDINTTGSSSQGIGIDDVSIKPCGTVSAPTASNQAFCSAVSPTVASLTATGTSIQWYSASTGGTALSTSTSLANSTTYYATQTVGGCESVTRTAVVVTINSNPSAPTGSATQTLCSGATVAELSATGSSIQWYAASSGGSALATNTALVNGTHYYASQTSNSCESTTRLDVTAAIVSSGSWIGGTSTDWSNASNWCGGVPTSATNVTIPSGTANSVVISSSANVNSLTISSGAAVSTSGTPTIAISNNGSFTNNGTFTAGTSTVSFAGNGTVSGTIGFNNVDIAGGVNFGSASTINGTLSINSGGYINTNAPLYGTSSTLKYNTGGTYGRSSEWSATSGQGAPYSVQLSNSTTLNYPNTGSGAFSTNLSLAANLTIDNGSALYMDWGGNSNKSGRLDVAGNVLLNGNLSLGNASGGDIKVGGNWTRNSGSTLNTNGRAVFFTGSGNSTITGNGGETFTYMVNEKTGGSILLGSNLALTAPSGGNALTHKSTASIDLNSYNLTFSGPDNSNILADGACSIIGTGNVLITSNTKNLTGQNTGSWTFGSNVVLKLQSGLNFGTNLSTINGTLEINNGGYVSGDGRPTYGVGSTLKYNSSGSYGRDKEWLAGYSTGAGVPYSVLISSGTTLDLGANSNFSSESWVRNELTVDGTFDMSLTDQVEPVNVLGNVTFNGGTLKLSTTAGGDIKVGGNWTGTGTFVANSRAVFINGTGNQTISRNDNFPYLIIDKTSGTLSIAGNITLNNKLTYSDGSISFTGGSIDASGASAEIEFANSSAYTLPTGLFSSNVNKLTVNGTGGITLSENVTVTNSLKLTSGVITLGSRNLTLSGGLDASGNGSSSSYINTSGSGAFIRSISSTGVDYKFPVGLSSYAPISVNFTGGSITSSSLASRAVSGLHPNATDGAYIRTNLYWEMNQTGMTNPQYNVSFTYPGVTNGTGSNETESNLLPAKWSASTGWLSSGGCSICFTGTTMGTSSINTSTKTITWNGVTGFSDFGGFGQGNGSPLPVELTSFSASCEEDVVTLSWSTASEQNSSHFDVEKSIDGEIWRVIGTVLAAGNSTQDINYSFIDDEKSNGQNYYRLNQVDIDGKNEYFGPIQTNCVEKIQFTTFPNPSDASFQVILTSKELVGMYSLVISDATGKVIEQLTIDVKEGINLFVINQELNPGIYFLNITNGAKSTQILRHAVK